MVCMDAQWLMRFSKTRAYQCIRLLETEVVQNRWNDNGKVLDVHGHGEGVQQQIQPRQSDCRSTLLEMEVVQNGWDNDSEVLDVHEHGK